MKGATQQQLKQRQNLISRHAREGLVATDSEGFHTLKLILALLSALRCIYLLK